MILHAIECDLLSLTLVVGGSDVKKVDHTDHGGGGGHWTPFKHPGHAPVT